MNVRRRAIAAQNFLFVDAHFGGREFDSGHRVIGREEQDAAAWPGCCQGVGDNGRMRDCHQHYIGAAPLSAVLNFLYQLTTTVSVEGLEGAEGQALGTS